VMDRGQQDDWFYSDFITTLAITSAMAFALLIWWELRHKDPIVDLRLMRDPDFAVSFVLMLMLGFMLLGSTYLIPAYVQSLMGYRAVDAGMVLTPGGLATIALLPLVGRSMNKVDLRLLVAIGLIIGGSSLLWMTNFYLDMSFKQIMFARMAQAASLPFLFIPINAMAFRRITPDKTNNASALINLARNFGGSIGISLTSTMLTRREQFHQSRLTEHLQSMNPAYPDFANQISGALGGGGGNTPTTLANIYQGAVQQATLLAYLDDFKILGLVFLGLLPFLLLVKPGKGSGGPVPGH
jgi:DHA2 family multidrug resistance protein